ncbi:unnamed protein product [Linum tenue]|uniref:Uncharacterized protein n=1 Tax=Linum tenue TaxID=586396 RepID=A0AAV0JWQ0_9ROSI|nr:unnamed protein product [Linum tenue]
MVLQQAAGKVLLPTVSSSLMIQKGFNSSMASGRLPSGRR